MPQATNITVVNGTAVSKTFTLAAPASGPSAPAVFFLREGANQTVFPKFEVSSDKVVKGNGRKIKATLRVPVAVTGTNGVVTSAAEMFFAIDCTVPALVPDASRDDAIAFVGSLITSALMKATFKEGYAPT